MIEWCFEAHNRSFRKDVYRPTKSCSWLSFIDGSLQYYVWRHVETARLKALAHQQQRANVRLPVLILLIYALLESFVACIADDFP